MANIPGIYAHAGDFANLQDAVDSDAGALYIPPGTHNQGSTINVTKSKIIAGGGRIGDVTEPTAVGGPNPVFNVTADFVTIKDMSIFADSGGYAIAIRGKGHALKNLQLEDGAIQDTGIIEGLLCTSLWSDNSDPHWVDLIGNDHMNLVFYDPLSVYTNLGGSGDMMRLGGDGNCITTGGGDFAPGGHYRYRVDRGSCYIHGIDYENGHGSCFQANNGGVLVVGGGCELKVTEMNSGQFCFRALNGSDIRAFGIVQTGSNNGWTFADTDGGSHIAFIESRTNDRIGSGDNPVSGNVYNLQNGTFGT